MDDIDPLADAFIDGLMAERNEALATAKQREAEAKGEKVSELSEELAGHVERPVPTSVLFRAIAEKGELTAEDIRKLAATEVRRGI